MTNRCDSLYTRLILRVADIDEIWKLKRSGVLPRNTSFLSKGLKDQAIIRSNLILDSAEGAHQRHESLSSIPRALTFNGSEILRTESFVSLDTAAALVQRHHPGIHKNGLRIHLAVDGVPESKSGARTLKVRTYAAYP